MEQFKFIGHIIYFVFSYGTVSVYRTYYYPLANEVAKGYSNATVLPSVTSL